MDPSMWSLGIPDGLYRLTPQASRWQLLGEPPYDAVEFSNIPGAGLLWCAQYEEDPVFAGLFPAAATWRRGSLFTPVCISLAWRTARREASAHRFRPISWLA